MKFFWDNRDLRKDVKALEKMYKEEQNPALREQIAYYIMEAKACIFEEENEVEQEESENGLDVLTRMVPIFRVYYPHINDFRKKLTRFIKKQETLPLINSQNEGLELRKEDIMDLVNELYKSIGGDIYEHFCKVYNNRHKWIRYIADEIDYANMIFIPGVNKPYMTLGATGKDRYRNDLIDAAHEMGHGLVSLMSPERYYGDDYFFNEIETTFFELIAQDFFAKELGDTGFYDDEEARLETYYCTAEDILANQRLVDKRYSLGNPTKEELFNAIANKQLQGMLLASDEADIQKDIKYLFSYIVAIELYEIYKQDPKTALEMLKAILVKKEKESEYTNITRIVTPNKSLIKFKNYITKKNKPQ